MLQIQIPSVLQIFFDKDGFLQMTLPPGAYKIESSTNKNKRNIIDGSPFTETDYQVTIQPNFSTSGSIIEISRQEPINTFLPDDSIRNLYDLMQLLYMKKITYHLNALIF